MHSPFSFVVAVAVAVAVWEAGVEEGMMVIVISVVVVVVGGCGDCGDVSAAAAAGGRLVGEQSTSHCFV